MPSKFTDHPCEADGDQSLFLILDKDGNFSADKENLERLLKNNKFPIKIVRMDTNLDGNASQEGNNDEPQIQLTVDDITPDNGENDTNENNETNETDKKNETNETDEPKGTKKTNETNEPKGTNKTNTTGEENAAAVHPDPSSSLVTSSLDILPSTSAEASSQETTYPFSEMNPEQLQRLEHALASDQARLILGENVAVIRDMLSVDDFCGSVVQKSIEIDHCYTTLPPSSDPNGPSPFVADVRNTNGNSGMGNQSNGRVNNNGNTPDRQLPVDTPQLLNVEVHHGADESEDETVQIEPEPIPGPSYAADITFEDIPSETTDEEEDDTSDEDYTDRSGKKRKKKPRRGKKAVGKKQPWSRVSSRPTPRQARTNSRPRSCQEVQKKTERSNDEMAEVMQSMSSTSKSEETKPEPTKDKGKDSGKSSGKDKKTGPKRKRSRQETAAEEPQVVESQVLPDETATASKPPPAKQPKKENKRAKAQRAEDFGPALFSLPDIIRRAPVAEELPQTTPEKRNFTVGAQKSTSHKEGESNKPPAGRRPTVTFQPGVSILRGPTRSPSSTVTKPKSLLKKPRTEVIPQPIAESDPEIEVVYASPPEIEIVSDVNSESTAKSKSDSAAKSKPESTPDSESGFAPQSKQDPASNSDTEANTEPQTESISESGSVPPPKSKSDSAPKSRPEPAAKSKADFAAKSKAESAHKSKVESDSKPKAESSRKTKSRTSPKSKAESARRSKSESTSKSKAKSFLQPQPESTPQHKAEAAQKKKGESVCQRKTESTPQRTGGSKPQRETNYTPQHQAESVSQAEDPNRQRCRGEVASRHRVAPQREESTAQPSFSGEVAYQPYTTNYHIQRILDEHHRQQRFRRYGMNLNEDDNVESYELDPTQMDQTLLQTIARMNYRNEARRLHEALILQEQALIGPRAGLEPRPRKKISEVNLDDSLADVVNAILGDLEEQEIEINRNEEQSLTVRDSPTPEQAEESTMGRSDDGDLAQPSTSGLGNNKTNSDKSEDENGSEEEESVHNADMDDALSETSWNSEDDPDRLWCVCKQPHNNRFMICCDSCEEWYHGKCVGVTKGIGRQMEVDSLEWSCPKCILRRNGIIVDSDSEDEDKGSRRRRRGRRGKKDKGEKEGKTSQNNSSEEAKDDQRAENERSVPPDQANEGEELEPLPDQDEDDDYFYHRQCIMCDVLVREKSLYCCDECLMQHSQIALSQLRAECGRRRDPEAPGPSSQPDYVEEGPNPRIIVMDPHARKVLVGEHAPPEANLVNWLREHPTYQIVYRKNVIGGQYIVTAQRVFKVAKRQTETSPGEEGRAQEPEAAGESETARQPQANLPASQSGGQGRAAHPYMNTEAKEIYQIYSDAEAGRKRRLTATIIVTHKPPEELDQSSVFMRSINLRPVTATAARLTSAPNDPVPLDDDKMSKNENDQEEEDEAPAAGVPDRDLEQDLEEEEEEKEEEPDNNDPIHRVRMAIRKTLKETFKVRVKDNNMDYSDQYVEELANDIEEELFQYFEKVDMKYKSRYRSLFFNLKDVKNLALFRRVLFRTITPRELVRLSPEDLANPELARWREMENQHQLEMIKKSELELMSIGNTYIMKSHKGEQVIESADSERAAAVAAEIDPNTPPQELVSALNLVANTSAKQVKKVVQDLGDDASKEKALDSKDELQVEQDEEAELMQDCSIPETEEVAEEEEEKEDDEDDEDEEEDYGNDDNNRNQHDDDEDDPEPAPSRGRRDSRHQGSRERESRRKSPRRDRDRKRGRSRSRSRSRKHGSSNKRTRDEDKSRHRHGEKKSKKGKRDSSESRDSQASSESRDSKGTRGSINSKDSRGSRSESSSDRNDRSERAKATDGEITHTSPADKDADPEPSSIVSGKTPDINTERPDPELEPESDPIPDPNLILEPALEPESEPDQEPQAEPSYAWKGILTMAEVTKFWAIARAVTGNYPGLATDIGDKIEVVGRIAHDTVWEYVTKMRKMPTREVILMKILPSSEKEKTRYSTFHSYLRRKKRMAVVRSTVDVVKDFYLYAWDGRYPLNQSLVNLSGSDLEDERRESLILGIVVRSKRRSLQERSLSNEVSTLNPDGESDKLPDRSSSPTLPDEDKFKKDPRLKKKIRVQVDFNNSPAHDDGDSPYSPGDSDEDLTPLPKIPKLMTSDISEQLQKFLSSASNPENLKDPVEIQRKIDEMNRAIELQTQQIQSLTSAVPMLTVNVPLPNISLIPTPLLPNTSAGILTIPPNLSVTKPSPEIEELPMESAEQGERPRSPPVSFTPMTTEEKIPFLPEEQSTSPLRKEEEGEKRVTLPPNLQEILNSINKKSVAETNEAKLLPNPAKAVEEIVKSNTPDINMALNFLTQTKSLLNSLSSISGSKESAEKSDESTPILSRLSDEDIIRKAKEMEELTRR